MPECQGVSTSKNKKSYAPYNIEYVKWLRFELEQNAPESPFWHSTLETHIPDICDSNWVLEGREITTLNPEYIANSIEAGVQAGDRGSGNELLVFMGTMTVAQQYLVCDKDASGRMTYNLYMLNVIPEDLIRQFRGNKCVHTTSKARVSTVYVRQFRPEVGNQSGHFQQNHLQVVHGKNPPLSFPDAWPYRKVGKA